MKDLGEASHILGIKLMRDCHKRMLVLPQATYIDNVLARFSMQNFKKKFVPFRVGKSISGNQRSKTRAEIERMRGIPYALTVGSLKFAMLCERPDIYFVVGMVSRYQSNSGEEHWIAVKHILKYLRRKRDYMIVDQDESL